MKLMSRPQITKGALHPRNRHQGSYDLDALIECHEPLRRFVAPNKYGTRSINFFDAEAVRTLNTALLKHHYNIEWWEIPTSALTPPIPGRADYIHYLADLVGTSGACHCLDIGTGASCIYPLIGCSEYGWSFVASDIEPRSLECASQIVERNALLRGKISLRLQADRNKIFEGVVTAEDRFDIALCNPPFHASEAEAIRGTERKLRGLGASKKQPRTLNFAGQSNELWCKGGERAFVGRMIAESRLFAEQCRWFTSLISSEDNLPPLVREIRAVGATEHRIIEMSQGNKRSRILAWRYI